MREPDDRFALDGHDRVVGRVGRGQALRPDRAPVVEHVPVEVGVRERAPIVPPPAVGVQRGDRLDVLLRRGADVHVTTPGVTPRRGGCRRGARRGGRRRPTPGPAGGSSRPAPAVRPCTAAAAALVVAGRRHLVAGDDLDAEAQRHLRVGRRVAVRQLDPQRRAALGPRPGPCRQQVVQHVADEREVAVEHVAVVDPHLVEVGDDAGGDGLVEERRAQVVHGLDLGEAVDERHRAPHPPDPQARPTRPC